MKKSYLALAFLAALGAIGMGFYSKKIVSPYLSFEEAIQREDRVQIIGLPVKSLKTVLDEKGCYIIRVLDYYDQSQQMSIRYCRALPQNIQHSEKLVAKGSYSAELKLFEADQLLFKCPSKYEKMSKQ